MGVEDFVIENGVLAKYKGAGGDVTIPEGVTEIGEDAFSWCESLESVTIPGSVTEIGRDAFDECPSLARVVVLGEALPKGFAIGPDTDLVSPRLSANAPGAAPRDRMEW